MATALFKDPQGKLVRLEASPEQLRAAYEQGYTPFTRDDMLQERHGDIGGMAMTALTGALGGMTLGLSTQLLAAQGEGVKQALAEQREANPGIALGSEILGTVVGAALHKKLPTPAGLVSMLGARVGRAVEPQVLRAITQPGIATKVVRSVVKGAAQSGVEGALFGAGAGIDEAALGDPARAGELIMAGALSGTVLGVGLGGVIGGVAGLTGGIKDKIGARLLARAGSDNQQYVAVLKAMKAMGLTESKAANLVESKYDGFLDDVQWLLMESPAVETGKGVFQPVLTAEVKSAEAAIERVAKACKASGLDIEQLGLHMRAEAKKAAGLARAAAAARTPAGPEDFEAVKRRPMAGRAPLDQTDVRPFETPIGTNPRGVPPKTGTQVVSEGPMRTPRPSAPIPEEPPRQVGDFAFTFEPGLAVKPGPKAYFERGQLAAQFENVMRKEAPEIVAGGKDVALWSELENMKLRILKGEGAVGKRAPYYDFKHLQELKQQMGSETFVERRLRQFIGEKQEELVQSVLGEKGLAGYKQAKRIYKSSRDLADELGFGKALDGEDAIAKAAKQAGRYAIRSAMFRMAYRGSMDPKTIGAMGVIGLPIFLAQSLGERALSQLRPPISVAYNKMRRLSTLGAMQTKMDATHTKFRTAVRETLRGVQRGLAYGAVVSQLTGEKDRQTALNKYRKNITDAAADPGQLSLRIGQSVKGFADDAPQTAMHAASTITRAMQVVQEVLPPTNTVSMLHSEHQKDVYSDEVLAKVDRVVGALTDPVKAIQRIAAGVGTPEEHKALMTAYPQLMAAAAEIISEEVGKLGRPLSWDEALRLRPFLGSYGHAMLEPRNIAMLQSLYVTPPPEQQPRPVASPRDKELARSYQTGTQRLENPR